MGHHEEVFKGDEDVGHCSVLILEGTTLSVQPSGSCPWPCAASAKPSRCDPDSVILLFCPLMKQHATACRPEINALCHPKTMRTHVTLLEPGTTAVLLFYYGATFLQTRRLSQPLLELPYLPFKK